MKCKYCDNEVLRGYLVCPECKPYVRWVQTLRHAGFLGQTGSIGEDLEKMQSVFVAEYSGGKDPRTIGQKYHVDGMRVREILKSKINLRTKSESALISEKIKSRSKNLRYLTKRKWIAYCSEQTGVGESEVFDFLQDFMNSHSFVELWETYKISEQALLKVGIKARSRSEATVQGYIQGKLKSGSSKFKKGYHLTWQGSEVFFRSSYEEDFMKVLDFEKVPYFVESLNIPYFDTQKNKERIAIPDFYLPQTNEIVEIKSTYTYDPQNMRDRVKAYRERGYGFRLILNHKDVPVDQLEESIA